MGEKHSKAVKRLGTRYGRTIRKRLSKVESQQRRKHRCPYCAYERVRRGAAGIWLCSKCGSKFTSRAYTVAKAPAPKTETSEV